RMSGAWRYLWRSPTQSKSCVPSRSGGEGSGTVKVPLPQSRLLELGLDLGIDGLDQVVDRHALGEVGELRADGAVHLIGEDAVAARGHLREPGREVLPDGFAAEEFVLGGIGGAVPGRQQRADRPLVDQDLLVEVDVLAIDLIEEVDGRILV